MSKHPVEFRGTIKKDVLYDPVGNRIGLFKTNEEMEKAKENFNYYLDTNKRIENGEK